MYNDVRRVILNKGGKTALGGNEPIAVAMEVSKADELLKNVNESQAKITVEVSANRLKNAMGVGMPGTGMNGLYIASALGACGGKSEFGLEVLKDISNEDILKAKIMVDTNRVEIKLSSVDLKLYIKASCWSTNHTASATICNSLDSITKL